MQFHLNKLFLGVSVFVLASVAGTGSVHANYIPDINGQVLVQGTNAPVARVWVKMTNKDGYSRYARTDSQGRYTFVGWTQCDRCEERQLNVPIDTDLDGRNDAVMYQADPSDATNGNEGSTYSCGRDPFTFSVVKPVGWSGSFTSVGNSAIECSGVDANGYCLNNSQVAPPAPVMYYITGRTSVTPTPTGRISTTVTPTGTLTPTLVPASCSFNVPLTKDIRVGTPDSLSVGVNQVGGTVDQVTFTSDDGTVVSVCNSPLCSRGTTTYTDSSASFSTGLTGFVPGQSTRVRISGRMLSRGISCTPASVLVNVTNLPSWCQLKESDAITNGSISCQIPPTCSSSASCNNAMIRQDAGESPGVAIASGSVSAGTGVVSRPRPPYGWTSKTAYSGIRYNYDFFEKKTQGLNLRDVTFPIITSVTNLTVGTMEEGYYWVRYRGGAPLEIDGDLNVGSNKIVLFVDNTDLIIRGNINVTRGRGFFMTIVEGNIEVDSSVGGGATQADLEGIYLTEKQLTTGTNGTGSDVDLHVRGSVIAFDKVVMERTLPDNSVAPAELFEFGPDQLLMFPARLGDQNFNWKEVAP